MNEKAVSMKKEIRTVSNHRALIISKSILSVLLALISIYLGIYKYDMSSIYILLFLNALPPILTFAFKDYAKKNSNTFLYNITQNNSFYLNNLKNKYKYSKVSYISNSISYLIALAFLGLWQYSNHNRLNIPNVLANLPFLILSISLLIRFIGIIFYQLKLPYDLSHNKVK